MDREKLVDFLFVFRIWAFEMIFERITAMRDASESKQGEILVNYAI